MLYLTEYDLVEVHSVRVVSKRGGGEHEIYGTIQLEDNYGSADLFKQTRDNPKSIFQDGTLHLTGPFRCFEGQDFFLTLKIKARHDDQDLDLGGGSYIMSPFKADIYVNKPLRAVCKGKDGYSVLHFRVVSFAIQATVEVALVRDANKQKLRHAIHGNLTARCGKYSFSTKYDQKYFQTTLLNVPEDELKELEFPGPDDVDEKKIKIPLSRNVVPAMLYEKLIIEVDLWDKPSGTTVVGISEPPAKRVKATASEPPAQHVKETVDFLAKCGPSKADRVESKFIKVEDVCIEVMVTFAYIKRDWSFMSLRDD